jgi:oxygen-independent coproporphyrinogen-3 oxidase
MSEASQILTVLPSEQEETTVGNYFVSNYPPFSLWTSGRVGEALDQLERPGKVETQLGMYVHIPFCRKRCDFCYFRVYTGKNSRDITAYLDAMIAEADQLARKPFTRGRKLQFCYFGGGTPSYLSDAQLTRLFSGLRQAFPWDEAEEITFECEPGTLTEKKVHAIRGLGVTRLSLGVENFDDDVLEANNRAHRSKEIYRAYEWARAAGYPQINIDLIAGMVGETEKNWRRCIEETIALSPDAITVYQMEVPHNTTLYRDMKAQGNGVAPVADWATKRRWVKEAFAAFEANGYTIGSAYTAVKDPVNTKFIYRDSLWTGADMLAVGVSSFGHLARVHYQNEVHMEPYIEAVQQGRLPALRALRITDEEEMIRQFVLQLKLGRLSAEPFRQRFGIDVMERWDGILKSYEEAGYLTVRDGLIELTRDGLLQVDRLLSAFFLPQHRGIRYT